MLNHKKDLTKKDLQLEELLRFKRAERPDEAYWNRFDRELHQRMLQTLVKKDPFHRQVLRAFAGKRFPVGLLTAAIFSNECFHAAISTSNLKGFFDSSVNCGSYLWAHGCHCSGRSRRHRSL